MKILKIEEKADVGGEGNSQDLRLLGGPTGEESSSPSSTQGHPPSASESADTIGVAPPCTL